MDRFLTDNQKFLWTVDKFLMGKKFHTDIRYEILKYLEITDPCIIACSNCYLRYCGNNPTDRCTCVDCSDQFCPDCYSYVVECANDHDIFEICYNCALDIKKCSQCHQDFCWNCERKMDICKKCSSQIDIQT